MTIDLETRPPLPRNIQHLLEEIRGRVVGKGSGN